MKYMGLVLHHVIQPASPQGKQGCKNTRAGGDTVAVPTDSSDESRFCTYVVYKSFKFPPPVKPCEPARVKSDGRKRLL